MRPHVIALPFLLCLLHAAFVPAAASGLATPDTAALHAAGTQDNPPAQHDNSNKKLKARDVAKQLNDITQEKGLVVDGKPLKWEVKRLSLRNTVVEAEIPREVYDKLRLSSDTDISYLSGSDQFRYGDTQSEAGSWLNAVGGGFHVVPGSVAPKIGDAKPFRKPGIIGLNVTQAGIDAFRENADAVTLALSGDPAKAIEARNSRITASR